MFGALFASVVNLIMNRNLKREELAFKSNVNWLYLRHLFLSYFCDASHVHSLFQGCFHDLYPPPTVFVVSYSSSKLVVFNVAGPQIRINTPLISPQWRLTVLL
jgi:hypothetical protein